MKRRGKQIAKKLPVVCFNRGDDLSVKGYMVKAKAITGDDVDLTCEDAKKLAYAFRVFKGLAAATAKLVTAQSQIKKKNQKAKEKSEYGNRKTRAGLSGRRLRRRFGGGTPGVPRPPT